jgi:hypothetical protein
MSTRMKFSTVLLLALAASSADCARNIPPPCLGDACRRWPHIEVRFWKNHGPPSGRRYTGALCVQVAFDCPEEGRHQVWIEPQAPRCTTMLNNDGGPEWLRVENGRLSIPWPARCLGQRVEMYVSAQPNFAICTAVNSQLLTPDRTTLGADLTFQCR